MIQTSLLILIALGYTLLQSKIGELDLMSPAGDGAGGGRAWEPPMGREGGGREAERSRFWSQRRASPSRLLPILFSLKSSHGDLCCFNRGRMWNQQPVPSPALDASGGFLRRARGSKMNKATAVIRSTRARSQLGPAEERFFPAGSCADEKSSVA